MMISVPRIAAILDAEDMEGLIVAGAPPNEYMPEAKKIASALSALSSDKLQINNVAAIIAFVWAQSFHLSAEQTKQRADGFEKIAQQIVG